MGMSPFQEHPHGAMPIKPEALQWMGKTCRAPW